MEIYKAATMDEAELERLMKPMDGRRITLVMPVEREPDKWRKNRIRIKNVARAAEEQLENDGVDQRTIEALVKPTEELEADSRYLVRQGKGLVVLLEDGFARAYQMVEAPLDDQAVVGRYFYIRALVPAMGDPRFYILDLSQGGIRLLRGTDHGVERVDLPDEVPETMAEGLKWDDPESQLQWHTGTGSLTPGGRAAMFHGHGVAAEESDKEDILRYFHLIDETLGSLLDDEQTPLVIAGVDYLLPIYKEANEYQHLVEEGIPGNHEHLSDRELWEKAWPVVAPKFRQSRDEALAMYDQKEAYDEAVADLPEVLSTAYQGRVAALFLNEEEQRWGDFGGGPEAVEVRTERQPGDEELLNLAAIYTLSNGGEVYIVPADQMPTESPAAAILRL